MTATLLQPQADAATVLTQATLRAADMLGLTGSKLARIIGVSTPTISRYRRGLSEINPDHKNGELALLLIRVLRSLDPLVGGDGEKRKAWMHSSNRALAGVPAELILAPQGLVDTLAYLDGMRAAT